VLTAPAVPDEQAGAARFGLSYQVAEFERASGWSNVPAGDPATEPQQSTLTVTSTFAAQNPDRVYDLYVFDSRADGRRAYDRVLLSRRPPARTPPRPRPPCARAGSRRSSCAAPTA
jgi:hypothetical protein